MNGSDLLRLGCALGFIALGVQGIRTKRLFIHLGVKPVAGIAAYIGGLAYIALGIYLAVTRW